jgi:hypothetical protein
VEQAIKYKEYSLSFTGHSLGSYLAELSVYYCHQDLDYPNVKAVTFDGPGSYEMMELLSGSEVIGSDTNFNILDFDITCYVNAPNIVNCSNTHAKRVYRLFPKLPPAHKLFKPL